MVKGYEAQAKKPSIWFGSKSRRRRFANLSPAIVAATASSADLIWAANSRAGNDALGKLSGDQINARGVVAQPHESLKTQGGCFLGAGWVVALVM
jgi:hypothetical protein